MTEEKIKKYISELERDQWVSLIHTIEEVEDIFRGTFSYYPGDCTVCNAVLDLYHKNCTTESCFFDECPASGLCLDYVKMKKTILDFLEQQKRMCKLVIRLLEGRSYGTQA